MIQTISSYLYDIIQYEDATLRITLNLTLNKNGNYAFSKYSNENGDFISVNPYPKIVIRYSNKDLQWESHHQVIINQKNIFSLRLGFKKFYKQFQRDDLFKYDNDGRIIELLSTKKDIIIIPLSMGQAIKIEPSVLVDNRHISYPAVSLSINKDINNIILPIDDFEGIYDLFQTINIYQAGMTLLQTYIGMTKIPVETTMEKIQEREVKKTNKINVSKSLFDRNNEDGYVSGTITPKKPTSLDDL